MVAIVEPDCNQFARVNRVEQINAVNRVGRTSGGSNNAPRLWGRVETDRRSGASVRDLVAVKASQSHIATRCCKAHSQHAGSNLSGVELLMSIMSANRCTM